MDQQKKNNTNPTTGNTNADARLGKDTDKNNLQQSEQKQTGERTGTLGNTTNTSDQERGKPDAARTTAQEGRTPTTDRNNERDSAAE